MPDHHGDHERHVAYFLVALAGLIAGLILGQLSSQSSSGSRVAWPDRSTLVPHPRSLKP